jgi:hypothetical protein
MSDTDAPAPAPTAPRRPPAPGPGPTRPGPRPDEPLGVPPAHNSGAVLALHADVVRDCRGRLEAGDDAAFGAGGGAEAAPRLDMLPFVEPLARTFLQAAAAYAIRLGADFTRGHLDAIRAACSERVVEALAGLGEALAALQPRAAGAGTEGE